MGKWFVLLLLLGCSEVYAHDARQKTDSLLNRIEHKVAGDLDYIENYKLYPTENIYTFLELDTKSGRIYQVQWSFEKREEFVIALNLVDLAESPYSNFELYPTKNIYTFILLDKFNGNAWHVQWGTEESQRTVRWIRRAR